MTLIMRMVWPHPKCILCLSCLEHSASWHHALEENYFVWKFHVSLGIATSLGIEIVHLFVLLKLKKAGSQQLYPLLTQLSIKYPFISHNPVTGFKKETDTPENVLSCECYCSFDLIWQPLIYTSWGACGAQGAVLVLCHSFTAWLHIHWPNLPSLDQD